MRQSKLSSLYQYMIGPFDENRKGSRFEWHLLNFLHMLILAALKKETDLFSHLK